MDLPDELEQELLRSGPDVPNVARTPSTHEIIRQHRANAALNSTSRRQTGGPLKKPHTAPLIRTFVCNTSMESPTTAP